MLTQNTCVLTQLELQLIPSKATFKRNWCPMNTLASCHCEFCQQAHLRAAADMFRGCLIIYVLGHAPFQWSAETELVLKYRKICSESFTIKTGHFSIMFSKLLTIAFCCSVAKLCLILCNLMDFSLPGSSVYRIFQTRILEWVAISFSRGFSRPRDWTRFLHWQVDFLPLSHQGSPNASIKIY